MNNNNSSYQPIACGFYDRLLAFATTGDLVNIRFRNTSGNEDQVKDIIEDVFTKEKAEYLQLKRGMIIRLDHLITVDDQSLPNDHCGIDRNSNPCGDASEY